LLPVYSDFKVVHYLLKQLMLPYSSLEITLYLVTINPQEIQKERVSLMQLSVAGTPGTPTKIDESLTKSEEAPSFYGGVSLTKSFGKTKVSFSTDKEQIKANEPVNL
jgi:hypothetical protein